MKTDMTKLKTVKTDMKKLNLPRLGLLAQLSLMDSNWDLARDITRLSKQLLAQNKELN